MSSIIERDIERVLENQARIEEKLDQINNKLDTIQDLMSEGVDENVLKHIMDMCKTLK